MLQDVTGKVTINFKDPLALRVLTKCLLKSDFNLDVDIPESRLVPTLPLRLNYILWLEDLMSAIQRNSNIKGIDIGKTVKLLSMTQLIPNTLEMSSCNLKN